MKFNSATSSWTRITHVIVRETTHSFKTKKNRENILNMFLYKDKQRFIYIDTTGQRQIYINTTGQRHIYFLTERLVGK